MYVRFDATAAQSVQQDMQMLTPKHRPMHVSLKCKPKVYPKRRLMLCARCERSHQRRVMRRRTRLNASQCKCFNVLLLISELLISMQSYS
jgi:hypothetical protein